MDHLGEIHTKIDRMERKERSVDKRCQGRRSEIESELKKKFLGVEFDPVLLKLVGTMPRRNLPSKDEDLIRKAVAGKYE